MKRITLLALTLLLLFGCQSKPERQEGKTELVFWTIQLADFKSTIQPMIDQYEQAHPNVRIKWIDIPGNEAEKRMLTAAMSPNVPDVVNLNPDFSATLATRKALLNMNEAVPTATRDTYLPVAWQAASIEIDGKPFAFGLPWYITSRVTLYNKNLLTKAGYDSPPAEYDQLVPFAQAVRHKTGQYALMPILTQSGNFLKELKKASISLYDAGGSSVVSSPTAIQHLQMYQELYRQGFIPPESLTEEHRAAVDRYQSGTLALLLVGPNFLNIVKENAPQVYAQTDVAPQFPAGSDYTDFSEMILVVPAKTTHPKEAVDFALFVTNAQNQLALAQAAPVLPSVTAALQDASFQQLQSSDLMARARSISAQQLLNAKVAYQIRPRQNEINELVNYYIQLALLGRLPVPQALQTLQQQINDLLK